jgi:hypothetical protein
MHIRSGTANPTLLQGTASNSALPVSSIVQTGQTEPAATNAPVGRSVHWMGSVFSFGAGRSSSQSFYFFLLTTVLFFFFLVLGRFSLDLTSHIATLLTFLPS